MKGRGMWVDGLKETQANLAYVPQAVREVFAEYIRETAENVARRADELVPVDEGDLKASQGSDIRSDGLQATVGYGDFKAPFVEFGTVDTPKQPFLYPAFRTSVRDFRRGLKAADLKIRTKVRRNYKGPKR